MAADRVRRSAAELALERFWHAFVRSSENILSPERRQFRRAIVALKALQALLDAAVEQAAGPDNQRG